MRRMRLFLIASAVVTLLSDRAGAQLGTPNPIEIIRTAPDYQFLRSLFPQKGPTFDPERDRVMSAEEQASATKFLSMVFEVQRSTFEKQSKSVLRAADKIGVRPLSASTPGPVTIELRDDQNSWSTAVSSSLIVLGARFLRGLVLGSLREAAGGEALFSKSLDSYLGSGPATPTPELEARARLFFTAARNGHPQIRTEADFREHFDTAIALMNSYLKEAPNGPNQALRSRLEIASQGGEITGADGMAMFDVFNRLTSHFDPALTFVLSHELGHLILGHAPYPPNLSCADSQKREDDADTFAIALLTYDIPGETEASRRALERVMGHSEAASDPDEVIGYGYPQAIRHGFALAGLSNKIFENCNYRDPADRIAFIDRLRATMIVERTEAIATLFRYFREHPPYVHSNADIDALTRNGKAKLARTLFEGCHSRPHPGNIPFKKLDELPFGWTIACPNLLPSDLGGADFSQRLGVQTWLDIADEYDQHVPASSLMTEDVIGSLAGSPVTARGSKR
jgi:hypothetical protein